MTEEKKVNNEVHRTRHENTRWPENTDVKATMAVPAARRLGTNNLWGMYRRSGGGD